MNKITINGSALPVRVTMGALLRFKRATGKEAAQIKDDMEDILTFMHCCLASACQADGIPFTMDVQEMADHLEPADVTAFAQSINGADGAEGGDDAKKK